MSTPRNLGESVEQLALVFKDLTGVQPRVNIAARDSEERPIIAVGYEGDELERAMQIEAYVVERGETIIHRSQRRDGYTVLVYRIEPKQRLAYHLSAVKPARVVPGPERHKWDGKPAWGESATCLKCGCVKHRLKTQPDYTERYQPAGTTQMLSERPACTGTPAPHG